MSQRRQEDEAGAARMSRAFGNSRQPYAAASAAGTGASPASGARDVVAAATRAAARFFHGRMRLCAVSFYVTPPFSQPRVGERLSFLPPSAFFVLPSSMRVVAAW